MRGQELRTWGIYIKSIHNREPKELPLGFQAHLSIPRAQMTLVLIGKGLCFGGLTFKNRGHLGSRYIFMVSQLYTHVFVLSAFNTFMRKQF